jgi:hypothetical protein
MGRWVRLVGSSVPALAAWLWIIAILFLGAKGKLVWALGTVVGGLAVGWAFAGPLALYLVLFPALVATALAIIFFAIRTAIGWHRNKVEQSR